MQQLRTLVLVMTRSLFHVLPPIKARLIYLASTLKVYSPFLSYFSPSTQFLGGSVEFPNVNTKKNSYPNDQSAR